MNSHKNARMTPLGRALLVSRVLQEKWRVAQAAKAAECRSAQPTNGSHADFLFFGFCLVSGLMIQNQNSQPWGILTAHASAAVAVARSGKEFDLPKFARIRLISPWLSENKTLMHIYLESIESGARVLESLPEPPTKVSVLDFANPFSAGFGLPPLVATALGCTGTGTSTQVISFHLNNISPM